MNTLDKEMNAVLGGTEQNDGRSHHATENNAQLKTYKLFISGIFYLIFPVWRWLQVTETLESENMDKKRLPYTEYQMLAPSK